MKSYRDHYHVENENLHITACPEHGYCEECGRGVNQQMFYVTAGAGPCNKMCEDCARRFAAEFGLDLQNGN